MIKRDVTFFNYADPPEQVTRSFYFNITKLEGLELQLTHGDLEATLERLLITEDAQQAFAIFKEILVSAVGVKISDTEFDKSEKAKSSFVNSPAMSVLIWELMEDPEKAGPFLEGMLPAEEVAAGREHARRKQLQDQARAAMQAHSTPEVIPTLDASSAPIQADEVVEIKKTDEEILAADMDDLSNEELERLIALRRNQS